MRRPSIRALVVGLLVAVLSCATLGTAGSAQAAPAKSAHTPYCGIFWGSLMKVVPGLMAGDGTPDRVNATAVRTGQHACYDRVVIDVAGAVPYSVISYDDYRVDGTAIVVTLWGVHADPQAPAPTVTSTAGFRTLRSINAPRGYQYGQQVTIGTRARLPFRVFTLAGPGTRSRLVIDVAHQW